MDGECINCGEVGNWCECGTEVIERPKPRYDVLEQRWCPKCGKSRVRSSTSDQSRVEFFCGTVVDQSSDIGYCVHVEGESCKSRQVS